MIVSAKTSKKDKDEYIYSFYNQLEWCSEAEGYIFTAADYTGFKSATQDLPLNRVISDISKNPRDGYICDYIPELCAAWEFKGGLRRYINPPHCPFYRIAGMWYCAFDESVRRGRSFRECYEGWASDYFDPRYPPR